MKKRTWILIVAVLLVVRLALPYVILSQLNSFMANFSKIFYVHIDDLSLGILRGAYRLEGLEAKIKTPELSFLKIEYIDISLAWRDLIRGNLRTDILVQGMQFDLSDAVIDAVKKNAEGSAKDTQKLGKKVFPVNISRVDIKNSAIIGGELKSLPDELKLKVNQIDGRLSNATATADDPISLLKMKAVLQDSATMYLVAEINQWKVPAEWLLSFEAKEFNIVSLNPFLKRKLPLTFTSGMADIYAEVKGENGRVEGYAKPFIKNLQAVGNRKDFESVMHFGIEVGSELVELIFSRKSDKTLATMAKFSYENGKFNLDKGGMVSSALEHGYTKELPTGLENKYQMKQSK